MRRLLAPPATSRFFFFNDTATTEIYTLSLHDALPICTANAGVYDGVSGLIQSGRNGGGWGGRSEEHTSELQSPCKLVWRPLLEKKTHWLIGTYHAIPLRRITPAAPALRLRSELTGSAA